MVDIAKNNEGFPPRELDFPRDLRTVDNGLEQVTIEAVHVGDYVFVAPPGRAIAARCVVAKCAKANERTARIVGWLVELNGGELVWWARGETLWRRRIA